ncbi:battenin-like [Penaeus chinensis]|uniref:battenin-like n=1 Tax=Penaeus chinensis TaxID=139456 RepID=UPI001FB6D9B6|nr:battenin-like [Penaeus chinensis]
MSPGSQRRLPETRGDVEHRLGLLQDQESNGRIIAFDQSQDHQGIITTGMKNEKNLNVENDKRNNENRDEKEPMIKDRNGRDENQEEKESIIKERNERGEEEKEPMIKKGNEKSENQDEKKHTTKEGNERGENQEEKEPMIKEGKEKGKGKDERRNSNKTQEEEERPTDHGKRGLDRQRRYRDLLAYWLLGFCNNFTYWVMITAAYDLLTPETQQMYVERSQDQGHLTDLQQASFYRNPTAAQGEGGGGGGEGGGGEEGGGASWPNVSSQLSVVNTFKCQRHSTGAILIADTLPATALTLAAPVVLLVAVNLRVAFICSLCVASYLTLGLAPPKFVFLGVALASASRGFSDTTFLGHASRYHKHVLSVWSSGTGIATFMGPLLYASLTTAGVDPRRALLSFLMVPAVIALSFCCVLSNHEDRSARSDVEKVLEVERDLPKKKSMAVKIQEKLDLFMRAQKYIFPLSVFYMMMYLTNQGLLEMVFFPGSILTHAQQYSWSNTTRCLGTLISRSAHKFFLIPNAWIYNGLALAILVAVGTEAYYHYLPSEYIVFSLLFLQGLLEGAAFRTTVFRIQNKTTEKEQEFCLGVFPVSLFLPAVLAGLASLPIHDYLCANHLYAQ